MSPLPITADRLEKLGACSSAAAAFRERFGDGAAPLDVATAESCAGTFDFTWAARHMLPAPLRAEYERQKAPLRAEYKRQETLLWAEYERQRTSLLAEYERQRKPLWAEYKRQRTSLLAEYERQRKPLLAEYKRQLARLFATLYLRT